MSEVKVQSHVGRDIVQSAQLFKTPEAAVWEYVVNSLQYVDEGTVPRVEVAVDIPAKRISILDNGSGMNLEGLQHFFTMHGENKERRKGVPGRGKFGTGKSAAFGIGSVLTVKTTQAGRRSTLRLSRDAIDASDGASVPVETVEREVASSDAPNGTQIVIDGIEARLAKQPIVALIERHLSAFKGSPVVVVNGRVCEIVRPEPALSRTFKPTSEQAALLGNVELVVCASAAPLDEIHRGVQVSTGVDVLVAIETAGVDTKEYGKMLFGHIECAALDIEVPGRPAAYTTDRSMRLNKANPVAMALIAFIGAGLEQVRLELVEAGERAKADADRARLAETTSKIEEILNADLKEFRERVEGLRTNTRRRTDFEGHAADGADLDGGLAVFPDGDLRGVQDGLGGDGNGEEPPLPGSEPETWTPPNDDPQGSKGATQQDDGDERVAQAGRGKSRMRGGLLIDFDYYGPEYDRYRWEQDERKIIINLDHPVVRLAKELPDGEATYRRLIWEIAFTAYAVALADLQFERDPALSSSDATFEIRHALRRVWASAGALYAS